MLAAMTAALEFKHRSSGPQQMITLNSSVLRKCSFYFQDVFQKYLEGIQPVSLHMGYKALCLR